MPFIQVKVIENVFTPEQKQEIVRSLTDALVHIEGEENRICVKYWNAPPRRSAPHASMP